MGRNTDLDELHRGQRGEPGGGYMRDVGRQQREYLRTLNQRSPLARKDATPPPGTDECRDKQDSGAEVWNNVVGVVLLLIGVLVLTALGVF